jgi:hypothetical protein
MAITQQGFAPDACGINRFLLGKPPQSAQEVAQLSGSEQAKA